MTWLASGGAVSRLTARSWMGLALAGCASEPLLDGSGEMPPVALVTTSQTGILDQRGRFREIFCALAEDHGADLPDDRPCDQALHRLLDEPPAGGEAVNLGRARIPLRLVVVPGLAAECFGESALPLRYAARHVEQLGYEVTWIDVDGLSSSARNAGEIRAAIVEMEAAADRPIVVLGYSKGMSDLLEASVDPEVAARVAAIVSLSGAVNGSPLADHAPAGLLNALAYLPGTTCESGDRGALNSLRRDTRMAWLATHRPDPAIRTYSVVSYADPDRVSAMLRSSYDDLSLIEPRNDSQLLFYDQIVPGSTLLGYINADHWASALPVARDSVLARPFVDRNAFPREILLEAILKYVEEDLMAAGAETGASAAVRR
jgi:hypothetical protein